MYFVRHLSMKDNSPRDLSKLFETFLFSGWKFLRVFCGNFFSRALFFKKKTFRMLIICEFGEINYFYVIIDIKRSYRNHKNYDLLKLNECSYFGYYSYDFFFMILKYK